LRGKIADGEGVDLTGGDMRVGIGQRLVLVGLLAAGIGVGVMRARGGGVDATGEREMVTVDQATLSRMVSEELERELPGAVMEEWKRQILIEAEKEKEQKQQESKKYTEEHPLIRMRYFLQILRSQLMLYKIQHADQFPPMEQMTEWKALLRKSYKTGATAEGAPFGPYIANPPVNSITQSSVVVATGSATTKAGWTYDEKTGAIRAIVLADREADAKRDLSADDFEIAK
jgi:hypothetical protein